MSMTNIWRVEHAYISEYDPRQIMSHKTQTTNRGNSDTEKENDKNKNNKTNNTPFIQSFSQCCTKTKKPYCIVFLYFVYLYIPVLDLKRSIHLTKVFQNQLISFVH